MMKTLILASAAAILAAAPQDTGPNPDDDPILCYDPYLEDPYNCDDPRGGGGGGGGGGSQDCGFWDWLIGRCEV